MGGGSGLTSSFLQGLAQLPLFFLVSGFFGGRIKEGLAALKDLAVKFRRLIIPALIFLGLWCYTRGDNFITSLFMQFKNGFWFTFALFEFILIYYVVETLLRLCRVPQGYGTGVQLLIGVAMQYVGMYFVRHLGVYGDDWATLWSLPFSGYYFYFVMGVAVSRHGALIEKCLRSWVFALLAMAALVGFLYTYAFGGMRYVGPSWVMYNFLIQMFGTLVVYQAFKMTPWLSGDNAWARGLKLIGRNTLGIYFIHYFVLPRNLDIIGEFFLEHVNGTMLYLCGFGVAVLTIACTMLLIYILKSFALTDWLLLGAKRLRTQA